MNSRIRFLFFVAFIIIISKQVIAGHIYYRDSVLVQGEYRYYNVHLPKYYNNFSIVPMIIAFHGGGGWGWASIRSQSSLTYLSDLENFIIVYPEGKRFLTTTYCGWNAGQCCEPSSLNNVDDVGFVNIMMDSLNKKYHVDEKRIYAVGSSNGGMFCLRLACELSERIAAIAVNAGTQTYFDCHPIQPVPIINFHSVLDSTVLFEGGLGNEIPINGVDFVSQDSMISIWKNLNNCTSKDTIYSGADTSYTLIRLRNCSCEYLTADFYFTTDGGHSWPGGLTNGNPVSTQIIATYLLWDFFKLHVIGCEDPSIGYKNITVEPAINLFPNPSMNGNFYLNYNLVPGISNLTIYNLDGKKIFSQYINSSFSFIPFISTSGIYIVQIKSDKEILTRKLVIE